VNISHVTTCTNVFGIVFLDPATLAMGSDVLRAHTMIGAP
jgi:hypothetical protein